MKFSKLALLFSAIVSLSACSNQWRETDESVSDEQAFQLYDDINVNGVRSNSALFNDLRNDESSVIYYAESGEAFGEAKSVMSFSDLGFLGGSYGVGTNVFDVDLQYAGVILVDAFSSNGERNFALMLKLQTANSQSPEYYTFVSNNYSLSDKKFEVAFDLQDGTTLLLRSFDVDQDTKGELAPSIHIKAFIIENGQEFSIGQFSNLRGFGGI